MPKSFSEEYPELYHYTGIAGLKGIIESQTLWATHYAYLNDSEEIIHFRHRLPSILRPTMESGIAELIRQAPDNKTIVENAGGIEKAVDEIASGVTTSMYNVLLGHEGELPYVEPYIISFCTPERENENEIKHGLLSQWRGYGSNGGYAIIFDNAALWQLLGKEAEQWAYRLYLGNVVYSDATDEEIRKEMKDDLDVMAKCYTEFFKTAGNLDTLEDTYDTFLNCACRYKHWGFSEEKEVRIVAIPVPLKARELAKAQGLSPPEKPIKHFIRGGVVIPYINMFEEIPLSPEKRLPIKRIIVGPHPEKEKRKRAIEIMLKQHGINAEVTVSAIPYLER